MTLSFLSLANWGGWPSNTTFLTSTPMWSRARTWQLRCFHYSTARILGLFRPFRQSHLMDWVTRWPLLPREYPAEAPSWMSKTTPPNVVPAIR